jgi:hypothetical protein
VSKEKGLDNQKKTLVDVQTHKIKQLAFMGEEALRLHKP